jgi:hypothetical protein
MTRGRPFVVGSVRASVCGRAGAAAEQITRRCRQAWRDAPGGTCGSGTAAARAGSVCADGPRGRHSGGTPPLSRD